MLFKHQKSFFFFFLFLFLVFSNIFGPIKHTFVFHGKSELEKETNFA